jgi:hypothetical protein
MIYVGTIQVSGLNSWFYRLLGPVCYIEIFARLNFNCIYKSIFVISGFIVDRLCPVIGFIVFSYWFYRSVDCVLLLVLLYFLILKFVSLVLASVLIVLWFYGLWRGRRCKASCVWSFVMLSYLLLMVYVVFGSYILSCVGSGVGSFDWAQLSRPFTRGRRQSTVSQTLFLNKKRDNG